MIVGSPGFIIAGAFADANKAVLKIAQCNPDDIGCDVSNQDGVNKIVALNKHHEAKPCCYYWMMPANF